MENEQKEPMRADHLLMTSISALPLPGRVIKSLHNAGVSVLADLVEMSEKGIMSIPNTGRRACEEIHYVLEPLGLQLRMELAIWQWDEIDRLKREMMGK